MPGDDHETWLKGSDATVRAIAERLVLMVREMLPDAHIEYDTAARLCGFTYQPGTYKGLIVGVIWHRAHVNLMFARGVELLDEDTGSLLTGGGKKARHIRFDAVSDAECPGVRELVTAAERITPRPER